MHPFKVSADKRSQINFIDYPDRAVPEHHRVLVYYIVSFCGTHDNNPLLGTKPEIGGADHVTHIFDEKNIDIIERQMFNRMFNQAGIKVTFFTGICIESRDPKGHNTPEIIITVDITGNGSCF